MPAFLRNQKEALGGWGGICNQLQFEILPFSIYWWCRIPRYTCRNSGNWFDIEHYSLFQGNTNKGCPKKTGLHTRVYGFPSRSPNTHRNLCVECNPLLTQTPWNESLCTTGKTILKRALEQLDLVLGPQDEMNQEGLVQLLKCFLCTWLCQRQLKNVAQCVSLHTVDTWYEVVIQYLPINKSPLQNNKNKKKTTPLYLLACLTVFDVQKYRYNQNMWAF